MKVLGSKYTQKTASCKSKMRFFAKYQPCPYAAGYRITIFFPSMPMLTFAMLLITESVSLILSE